MKKILFALLFLPFIGSAQNCVKVDSVYSTAKLRELGNRDIKFGIKQIMEEELSNKYCLSAEGSPVILEVFYFGIPKKSIRVVGVEKTDQITQVGVKIYYNGKTYQGIGESETEVKAVMIEVSDGKIPFSKMTVSSALKKAIKECVSGMP
jgi:hypothetical protein